MKRTIKILVVIALALAIVFAGSLLWKRPEIQNLISGKLTTVTTANPADTDKSAEQLAYESAIGSTDTGLVGFSPYGKRISNQFADRRVNVTFRSDVFRGVFRGLDGTFNSVGEVRAAVRTEDSTAWKKAFELMLRQQCLTSLDANAQAEKALSNSQPWLVIHVNACQRGDDEIRRHLEQLDRVPIGTYQDIKLVRYRTHWVTRITEVTEAEYNSANDFSGWSPDAHNGTYRAKYGVMEKENRFFVLEIFEDETKWARLVVHTYENPTDWSRYSLGGVRHDDLSIILPKEECKGSFTPDPAVTAGPTAKPTLEPKSPHERGYVQPKGVEVDPLPAETPNPESTDAPAPAVTAAPTAEPTQAPTEAPVAVAEIEPETQVQSEATAVENFPGSELEPQDIEPGLSEEPNNEAIADPFS